MTSHNDELAAVAVLDVNDGPAAGYVPRPEAAVVLRRGDMACVLVRSTTTSSVHVGLYSRQAGIWEPGASAYGGSVEGFWCVLDEEDESDEPLGVGVIGFAVTPAPGSSVLIRNGSSKIRVPLIEGRWGLHVEWEIRCSDWDPEFTRVG